MATPNSTVQLAYEHTPRFENAPVITPYDVSTAVRYMPITSFRVTPAPALQSREDELRGVEGAVAQVLASYAPAGDLAIRAYVNDLIFLLGLAGFQATVVAGAATLDQWTVAQGGTWTGGTFTLTIGAQTTNPIPYNATAAQVQAALAALSTVGSNNVVCTGGPLPTTLITVIFTGALAGISQTLTGSAVGLTGTAPTLTLVHTATGANGGSAALPDGGFPPTGVNVWTFNKRAGLNAKTAQLLAVYFNEAVYLQGQGMALSALGGNAAGDITGSWTGLVVGRLLSDPNLSPAYDTSAIPWLREGDMKLTWLNGSAISNDFTWAIANPIEAIQSLGVASFYPDTMFQGPGRTLVTGTIPKRSIAAADFDALITAATFSAVGTWHSPKMIGAANASYPYSMFLQMPSAQYTGGDPDPLTNARRFGASFNWFASYDEASGYDAKFTLISSLAATAVASAGVGL